VSGAAGQHKPLGNWSQKLYQTYQVFADSHNPLEIRALTAGQGYWFAIEAFNENGVSKPSRAVHVD
jgi:xylan 1,4-beta-xylosidase